MIESSSLETAIGEYRRMYDVLQPEVQRLEEELERMRAPLVDLERQIKDAVIVREKSVEAHQVKVTYRRGYTRTKWDGKGLDGFMVAHPEIAAFRSESQIKPSASIKVL